VSRQRPDNDTATQALYERLRCSPEHGAFIKRVEARHDSAVRLPATVVVVPGAFYHTHHKTGADGKAILEEAARLGACTDRIPLPNLGSLQGNARLICDWLSQRNRTMVLVSLSKGGADVKMALEEPGAADAFRNVAVWINVSGIINGTPLVNWLFAGTCRSYWTRFLLWARGYDFAAIRELDHRPGSALDFPVRLPTHLKAIHVVGFPQQTHLTHGYARRGYKRVAHLGPNDGAGILLADVLSWPGLIYPVWGADHYLQMTGNGRSEIIRRVLASVADELRMEVAA